MKVTQMLRARLVVVALFSPMAYADRYGVDEHMRDSAGTSGEYFVWFLIVSAAVAVLLKVTKHSDFGWRWLPVATLFVMMMLTLLAQFVLLSPIAILVWFFWFRKK